MMAGLKDRGAGMQAQLTPHVVPLLVLFVLTAATYGEVLTQKAAAGIP
jgi:hypothetical protein